MTICERQQVAVAARRPLGTSQFRYHSTFHVLGLSISTLVIDGLGTLSEECRRVAPKYFGSLHSLQSLQQLHPKTAPLSARALLANSLILKAHALRSPRLHCIEPDMVGAFLYHSNHGIVRLQSVPSLLSSHHYPTPAHSLRTKPTCFDALIVKWQSQSQWCRYQYDLSA